MPKQNSIIILSHRLTPKKNLSKESRLRIDKGIYLFLNGAAEYIIMNGGPGRYTTLVNGRIFVPRGTHPVHCEIMRDYAINHDVPPNKILMQNFSVDTIGEAYFVKEMILMPNSFLRNIIVSSDTHLPRARIIYKKILGSKFSTKFVGVKTRLKNSKNILSREKRELRLFNKLLNHIKDGDSEKIEKAIYESHHRYYSIPKNKRWLRNKSPKVIAVNKKM